MKSHKIESLFKETYSVDISLYSGIFEVTLSALWIRLFILFWLLQLYKILFVIF